MFSLPFLSAQYLNSRAGFLPAVIVPAVLKDAEQAREFTRKIQAALRDDRFAIQAIELRCDVLFSPKSPGFSPQLEAVIAELAALNLPLIATVRTVLEGGGSFNTVSVDYFAALKWLLENFGSSFAAIDIELGRANAAALAALAAKQQITPIISYHNWDRDLAASEISELLSAMQKAGAAVCKIAVTADTVETTTDFIRNIAADPTAKELPVIAIAMGEVGIASRHLATAGVSCATFGVLDQATAPGQLSVAELNRERNKLLSAL